MTTRSGSWIAMPPQPLDGVLPQLLAVIAAALERRRQRERLAALDPRLLRDIGVSVEEAWRESRRPFWQR
ncbi:DUF1127 domain-containing protein [Neoroseomonas oryzicola]|uniref:DUF1127 domain-containing protein n=1 Tax=Neoroseomonas oryzicola TaxID=535904 RepID=A0A9X9WLC4_9PROT|nr:DUF1127 domain-containing protein [Neoroseomonas oryzicola]MBR0661134.1 DUF1127 domain-containing protein [Neoroseomonas oryzicola]NKE15885.1 DUF1127 domain-containing protein [Neoroseomonas oryzicola]